MPLKTSIDKPHCSGDEKTITFTVVDSLQDLMPERDQIDSLSSVPFLKSSWMFSWIETYCGPDCQLQFLIAKDINSTIIGYAPLALKNSAKRGRHLVFIGSGKTCADYMTFPTVPGCKKAFIQGFADWLLANREWDRIELDGVTCDDEAVRALASETEERGCITQMIPTLSSWRMELPENWEAILQNLSKNRRKKYRQLAKKLDGKTELHEATDADSLQEGLQILERLHTARWNSLGEEGCFGHPGFREHLSLMAKEKLASQTLSLIWLTFEGQPIAADIGYYGEGGMFTYQGGVSPDHLHLEPGRAILKCQMELAMQRNAAFIDFLRGDEPYKAQFKAEQIDNMRCEIVHPSIRAKSIHSLLQIGRLAKALLK